MISGSKDISRVEAENWIWREAGSICNNCGVGVSESETEYRRKGFVVHLAHSLTRELRGFQ